MTSILTAAPGQQVTIVLDTLVIASNNDGYRHDGYSAAFGHADGYSFIDGYYNLPIVQRIFFPSLSLAQGYPQKMARLDNGLYYFQFTLPTGAAALGSYIVDISYISARTTNISQTTYQVIVTAPFGMYSVGTF